MDNVTSYWVSIYILHSLQKYYKKHPNINQLYYLVLEFYIKYFKLYKQCLFTDEIIIVKPIGIAFSDMKYKYVAFGAMPIFMQVKEPDLPKNIKNIIDTVISNNYDVSQSEAIHRMKKPYGLWDYFYCTKGVDTLIGEREVREWYEKFGK